MIFCFHQPPSKTKKKRPYIVSLVIYFFLGLFITMVFLKVFKPESYHQKIGDWARKLGFYDLAVERYTKSIHYNANNARAFNSRGVARYYADQFDSAVKDYDQAISLDPQYSLAIKNRALAFLALGKIEAAKEGYELACKLGRCEDFTARCPELKIRCDEGECVSLVY